MPSPRSRLFAAGYADGSTRLIQMTSQKLVAQRQPEPGQPVHAIAIAPKENGLLVMTPKSVWRWDVEAGHPETTLSSLFGKVWYEGYDAPAHVWQSSSGSDDFEPKYGLVPLIFGTLKATTYSLLFGVPIALLAAVYTSEFLHPRVKARIKPTIELMASLPSVVLGFLAALIFARMAEDRVPAILVSLVTVPGALLLGAFLWQIVPQDLTLRFRGLRFPLILLVALPAGVLAAMGLGPFAEHVLFGGDIRQWLSSDAGSPIGGWVFVLLPVAALLVAILMARFLNPWLRRALSNSSRRTAALVDLARFGAGLLAVLLLAFGLGWLLTTAGLDLRGDGGWFLGSFRVSPIGTYVQRNALIVGFVMGFAIIPIIYTIAEDALSTVPEHLRSASLGAGATPWQTAVRIIIPTAMSGLFSAVMIGVGRAVGETMIVLMAAGNTPIMDMNLFNGFRTLSANIAVEMPEAPAGSTHARVLYLAALTLFVMTFVLNTVAESVRQRFRKRAYQL
jgi:phosphate transport system permease protein